MEESGMKYTSRSVRDSAFNFESSSLQLVTKWNAYCKEYRIIK
jgi:hypothetical protein